MVPAGSGVPKEPDAQPGLGYHQDGTGSYSFNMMGNINGLAGTGGPTPLVQVRRDALTLSRVQSLLNATM